MFSMTCTHCHNTRLMNLSNIVSMHRTSEGVVAYVKCHCGSTTIHLFARERVGHGPVTAPVAGHEAVVEAIA